MKKPVLTANMNNIILRRDLIEAEDLKQIFRNMRHLLAGNFVGTTRDERLAEQLIFLLLCKIKDELTCSSDEPVKFQLDYPQNENQYSLIKRISQLFSDLKDQYSSMFDDDHDRLLVDEASLSSIVESIEKYSITEASRDAIGDAFEVFLGPSLRGNKGQFFTPKNIVQTMTEILNPTSGERFIDPACGTGGFLIVGLTRQTKMDKLRSNLFFGIDKDCFLAKITQLYLAVLGLEENVIFCENSLNSPKSWKNGTFEKIKLNSFDIVCTNPPFGAKIPIKSKKVLQDYHLGYKWKKESETSWIQTKVLLEKQSPQILFIERCLKFLKKGGRLGIILPDGIFGNPSDRYILNYLFQEGKIIAVISCSHLSFLPYTHTKTSLLFIEKVKPPKDYSFFMAIAENVGHDKNGKTLYLIDQKGEIILDDKGEKIINDDFPKIVEKFKEFKNGDLIDQSRFGFSFKTSQIDNYILIPEYYNPEISRRLEHLKNNNNYLLLRLGDLVEEGIVRIKRGHEIGSKFYGTGKIPFVRTSDIINWEINIDPKKQVSQEVYDLYKDKQDIKTGDILLVSDGTFLIGKTAMITEKDTQIIIQSHLKKIRVLKKDFIDEFLLLWSLNTHLVQDQIKAKTFIQSTISTLGNRLMDLKLPIPRDLNQRNTISNEIKKIINEKMALRERIRSTLKIFDL